MDHTKRLWALVPDGFSEAAGVPSIRFCALRGKIKKVAVTSSDSDASVNRRRAVVARAEDYSVLLAAASLASDPMSAGADAPSVAEALKLRGRSAC